MQDSEHHARYLRTRRIPNLDGLRGLAILLVLAHHAPAATSALGAQFQHNSKHGVSLFFVISGYIVMTMMLREFRATRAIDIKGFLWRRVLRLWPLYYVILLAEAFLVYGAQVYSPENQALFSDKLGCYLLYCSNWLETSGEGPFFVAWSLAVEEQFYLLLSLLLVLFRPAVLPLVLGGFLAMKILLVNGAGIEVGALPWRVVLSYSEAILLGVLLAYVLDSQRGFFWFTRVAASPTWALFWLGIFMVFLVFGPLEDKSNPPALVFYGVCTLLVCACAVSDRLPWLGGAAMSRVGLLSYGIYLMHMPVLSAVKKVTMNPMLVTVITLVIVLPLAWLSFTKFEEPIRQLGRKRSGGRGPCFKADIDVTQEAQKSANPAAHPRPAQVIGTTANDRLTPGLDPLCEPPPAGR